LVNVVRRSSELFSTLSPNDSPNRETTSGLQDWTGLPVIFDEVFTGLYRLGRFTSSSFLKLHADISVHAKLLTGGLVPLCTTLASESVFKAFESDSKADALLHGHSYTAHPVGCHVAVESVAQMEKMEREGDWDWAKKDGWTNGVNAASSSHQDLWSIWSKEFINWLSHQQSVEGAWALGSVLAIHMRTSDGGGYTSTVAQQLRDRLRHDASGGEDGPCNVHSRVLGNVIYFMGSQTSKKAVVRSIEKLIQEAL
jgi:dethiobiotin synthetase/adenosylmethionine--8-amino-7-oxononanoate aminotransferase